MDKEILEEVKKLNEEGLSLRKISKKLNRYTGTIREYLVILGKLPEKPQNFGGRKRKYHINDDFFESIDTENKAYILGFIYADGCVHEKRNRISITLKSDDEQLLIKVSNIMESNFPIVRYFARYSKEYKYTEKSMFSITSKKIVTDLAKIGCVGKKSDILKFPEISDEFKSHFMRGYFDGDGSVFITNTSEIKINVLSTKEFCEKYLKFLPYNGISGVKKEYRSNKNVYYISIGGAKKVRKIFDFLYKDSNIFLTRKKIIFDSYFSNRLII